MQTILLTSKQVCERYQCGRSTLTYWRKKHSDFPQAVYLGERSPRFRESDLAAYFDKKQAEQKSAEVH